MGGIQRKGRGQEGEKKGDSEGQKDTDNEGHRGRG